MEQAIFSPFLRLTLEMDRPRFSLRPQDLFALAMRHNQNRAFLFVSKVLGKHLPIRPGVLPAAGKLLALALEGETDPGPWADILTGKTQVPFPVLMERLEESRVTIPAEARTLFVGFAETATGLARAVAACFAGNCDYISTTRFPLAGEVPLTFEESHSHAKTHLLYLPNEDLPPYHRAVIVDDEFTTGSTALKLVEALHRQRGIRRFTLLSLLDWTQPDQREALAAKLGIEIELISLLHGRILGAEPESAPPPALEDWRDHAAPPAACAPRSEGLTIGRTLDSAAQLTATRRLCRETARAIGSAGPDALFLGTGELIYEGALIAGYCGASRFHSTTQSPVCPLPGSAIESGVRFQPPDQYSQAGYVYNIPPGRYRRAVILSEGATHRRQGLDQLADWLRCRVCPQVEVALL